MQPKLLLVATAVALFGGPLTVKAEDPKFVSGPGACDAVLYTEPDVNLSVSDQTTRNAMRHYICSTNAGERARYLNEEYREYRNYCNINYGEARNKYKSDTRFKGSFVLFEIPIGLEGSQNLSKERWNKWYSKVCSVFSQEHIYTQDDYDSYYRNNCSDMHKANHRHAYRYELQRTGQKDRVQAWKDCMLKRPDPGSHRLSCWASPDTQSPDRIHFNIDFFSQDTELPVVKRSTVENGQVRGRTDNLIYDSGELLSLSTDTMTINRRDLNKGLDINVRALHRNRFNVTCAVFVPPYIPKKMKKDGPKKEPLTACSEPATYNIGGSQMGARLERVGAGSSKYKLFISHIYGMNALLGDVFKFQVEVRRFDVSSNRFFNTFGPEIVKITRPKLSKKTPSLKIVDPELTNWELPCSSLKAGDEIVLTEYLCESTGNCDESNPIVRRKEVE